MTNHEAVEILKGDFSKIALNEKESHSDVFTKAFNMAIEALQELQHYKELEEQGRLIVVPVPVDCAVTKEFSKCMEIRNCRTCEYNERNMVARPQELE